MYRISSTALVTLIITLVIALISAISLVGCGGPAETFVGGMAAGSALSNTLDGAQRDLDARQAKLITERSQTLDQFEQANDDAEKLVLQARVGALTKQIEQNAGLSSGVKIADNAMETDWNDPEVVGGWITAGIMTLGYYLKNRKNTSLTQLLTSYQEGIEKFKAKSDPEAAEKIYTYIGERKQINGV